MAMTSSHLAIGDVFAVYLEELLCESLLLFGGGRHHSGLAQGWEHGRLDAVLSGRAIRVLRVGCKWGKRRRWITSVSPICNSELTKSFLDDEHCRTEIAVSPVICVAGKNCLNKSNKWIRVSCALVRTQMFSTLQDNSHPRCFHISKDPQK